MFGPDVDELIRHALAEDVGPGDLTTRYTVDPTVVGKAEVVAKEDFVLCGAPTFMTVFMMLDDDIAFTPIKMEGDTVRKGETVITLEGPMDALLTGERVALNFLQRLSGIATLTSIYVDAVEGTKARILDTRKTTPGLRALEKYAVMVGGGYNHRFGLFDGILIKDNHIAAAGGIANAVSLAKNGAPHTLKIEVECSSIKEVKEALKAGVDIIMLDNMEVGDIRKAVDLIGGKATVEASGNMTVERAKAVAETGVDLISVGALTHSARAVDLSMKIKS